MLKVLLTDEMQSAIFSATPEDAALLTRAIIAEFKDLEQVELPAHLAPLMAVFKQQISKLKASYYKKVADTNRRVQKYREKQAATVVTTDIPDADDEGMKRVKRVTCVSLINTKTKTKENNSTTYYQKEKPKKKEKGKTLGMGFGGKSPYIYSAITSTMDIFSDKPEEHIAADLCQTNSAYSINTWRKLAKLSPWTFRDEIATLYSEMAQGEIPDNPAAVLTWRVQRAYKREGIQS